MIPKKLKPRRVMKAKLSYLMKTTIGSDWSKKPKINRLIKHTKIKIEAQIAFDFGVSDKVYTIEEN